jgi:hypothetical protein
MVIRNILQESSSSKWSTARYTTVVESSIGIGGRTNDRKRIRQCQENLTCDLKLQCDCYKSVARIRLVKREIPSACAAVSWKVLRIAIGL